MESITLQERIAQLYDEEILSIWSEPFGKMLLDRVEIPLRSTILDAACGTGYPSLQLLKRLDPQSRIVALDSSYEMLNVARDKAGPAAGKRIFFKHERMERTSFPSETFDLVLSNCGIMNFSDPRAGLRQMVRVLKRGCQLVGTIELRGSFREFYDIYREVLLKFDMEDVLERLEEHIARRPHPEGAVAFFSEAGLRDVDIATREFSLLFSSGREFFFSPLIEYGFLNDWKEIISGGERMQRVFWHIKNAIDLYYQGRAFDVTVIASCLCGRKK